MTSDKDALHHDRILILDFGSQVTQLIARRVRESGVYCEIIPFSATIERIREFGAKGIILSGGPASVLESGSPAPAKGVFDLGLPVLGICYGQQTLCQELGGVVEGGHTREFGRAFVDIIEPCALTSNADVGGNWAVGGREQVWMSHGDRITELPPGFRTVGTSEGAPFAIIADDERRYYGVMFHPEVVHTPHGAALIRSFTHDICGCDGAWTMAAFRDESIARIRAQVGNQHVICGLSGGVDSAVTAVLLHEALGDQLTCIFVDNGLLRAGEAEEVVRLFRDQFNIPLIHSSSADKFLTALAGLTDPELKRKAIGKTFIEVFEHESKAIGGADFLAQGTLYPDVIESVSFTGGPSVTIKSHHNVGGLPDHMRMKLVEPLRELFKDEVRVLGRELGLPDHFVGRHPFPGPGLAIRIPGDITQRKAGAAAQGRHHLPGRNPRPRPVRRDLAGLRRSAAGEDRGRDGRRPVLRPCVCLARGDLDRRDDGGLLPVPA